MSFFSHNRLLSAAIALILFFLSVPSASAGEFAFLVGVGDYDEKQLRRLQFSQPDIADFRAMLTECGMPEENIVILHDDLKTLSSHRYLANGNRIRHELKVLLDSLEPDDSLIVALAGHGVQYADDPAPYFCPLDAVLEDKSTLISLAEVMSSLEKARPRLKLLLVDACRNDPQSRLRRSSDTGPKIESLTLPQLPEDPQGLLALFSCATGQEALEHPDLGHGIFFYHVLQAFNGEGDVDKNGELTLDELVTFTKDRTRTYARTKFSATQTPRQIGSIDGAWIIRDLTKRVDAGDDVRELDHQREIGTYPTAAEDYLKARAKERSALWKRLADRNAPDGLYLIGKCHELGVPGFSWSHRQAAAYYLKAAEQGYVPAQRELNTVYQYGVGVGQNTEEATKWLLKAAEQGDAEAQFRLGSCFQNGIGVGKNTTEARKWFLRATEQSPRFQYELGGMYEHGDGIEQNDAEAVKWYRLAAERGYARAQLSLGFCYQAGKGVGKNPAEAMRWFLKSAEQDAGIFAVLGSCYESGTQGFAEDEAEAVKWYRRAADRDHAESQFKLGDCYLNGIGVQKNPAEAMKWFLKAAEKNAGFQYELGAYYRDGTNGFRKEEAEAVKWFLKAAELDLPIAQFSLGECYEAGIGVPKDEMEAVKWYRRAAKDEIFTSPKIKMGECYEKGIGVLKDEVEAVKWYRQVAELEWGGSDGQYKLGECYENGIGVQKNRTEAIKWYRLAADQWNEEAKNALKRLGVQN